MVTMLEKKNIFEKVHCNYCHSGESSEYMKSLRLVKCAGCGLIYMNERLPIEALRDIYSQDYFKSPGSYEIGYDDYQSNRAEIRKTFIKRLETLEKLHGGKRGKSLDVGCAMGFFVETAKEKGWQAEGVDISEYCAEYAKSQGLKVTASILKDFQCEPETFDLVTMWDYIEHSTTPMDDLKKAFQLLKKGGLLALATPDISSIPAKVFKANWMGFKEHEHLFYFSTEILKKMLQSAGFEILKTGYAGKYVTMEFFARRLGLYFPRISKWLRFLIKKNWIPNFDFYCNPWDITLIYARKS